MKSFIRKMILYCIAVPLCLIVLAVMYPNEHLALLAMSIILYRMAEEIESIITGHGKKS